MTLYSLVRTLFYRRLCAACGLRSARLADPYCSIDCARDDD